MISGFIPTISVSQGRRKLIIDYFHQQDIPYMISAGSMYNSKTNQFRWRKYWNPVVIDSGGYSLMTRWGKFPFSPEQYSTYFDAKGIPYFAMDYPTEQWDPQECIEKTVKNWVLLPHSIPVVQGSTPEDFLYCFEQLQGIRKFTVAGVGSICKRGSLQEIKEVVSHLCQPHPEIHFHLFGLTQKAIPDMIRILGYDDWSWDSHAWTFVPREFRINPDERKVNSRIAKANGFKNKVEFELFLLKRYLNKIESFFPSKFQTKLTNYFLQVSEINK